MFGFLALLLVGVAALLWFRRAMAVAVPRNRTGFVCVWAVGALLGVAGLLQGDWLAGVAGGVAILVAGFLLLSVSVSRQKVAPDAIRVGAKLPDFSAPAAGGETFELASLAGRPLLLKFFRGHW